MSFRSWKTFETLYYVLLFLLLLLQNSKTQCGTGEVSNISLDVATIKALSDSDKDIVLDTQLIKYHVSKSILEAPYIGYETVYSTDTVDEYAIIHVQTLDETNNVKILTREQIKKWINTYA